MSWEGKKIHFVGIKGTGVSGLAILLKREGAIITGSDVSEEFPSEIELKKNGINVTDFNVANITNEIELVIYSSAWKQDNVERREAAAIGIKEMSYAQALSEFASDKDVIVVTGTHGKTTTTALLGEVFEKAGFDPYVLAGDALKAWGSSTRSGKGKYFIVEGDEYQEKFKLFSPKGIVIPSLDYDHPDYFKDADDYVSSFKDWIKKNSAAFLVTTDQVKKLLNVNASLPEKNDEEIFSKSHYMMPGQNYKNNALLCIRLAREFGIPEDKIIGALNEFKGVGRRLDFYTNENSKIVIVYDYAHHPVEIQSTLAALKQKFEGYKIVAIFQPHTYTRTKVFLDDFSKSFSDADEIFFADIYASAREKREEIKIEDLIKKTSGALHFREFDIKKYGGQTILVFMGAGDIWQNAKKIALSLQG